MKILIYANGGEKIGLGHIMRCLRLAFYLKGCDISFASDDKKWLSHGHELIKNAGFKLYKIPNHQALASLDAQILLIDSYDVRADFFTYIKNFFYKVVCIDDECELKFYDVDLIINPNPYASTLPYKLSPRTKTLFGLLFLRTEFIKAKKITINKNIKNIFLTLGGSDDKNLSYFIAKSIQNYLLSRNVILHIAIAKAFKYKKELLGLESSFIKCYENAPMAELMLGCDVGICACGQTVYEFLSLGVPIISFVLASNQKNLALFGVHQGYLVFARPQNIAIELEKMSFETRLNLRANINQNFCPIFIDENFKSLFFTLLGL